MYDKQEYERVISVVEISHALLPCSLQGTTGGGGVPCKKACQYAGYLE